MIAEKTTLILLAAGRSARFGDTDKLSETFLGKPLALHVVTAIENIPFMDRIVVKNGTKLDFGPLGYRVVHNDEPGEGLSRSVRLGLEGLRDSPEAVLFALADMPRVTAAHIYRLLETAEGPDAVVASSNGEHPCPPAIFGAAQIDALKTLEGDNGARDMVRAGKHVVTSPAELIDIDTPDDLARLRAQFERAIRAGARRSG